MDSSYKLHATELRYSVNFSSQKGRLLIQSPLRVSFDMITDYPCQITLQE